ncbi:MAG: acetate--CoA ligase family protein [Deltaproteobacteria bacterium]|jgi:succinyl-CoA synthetase beta subunit|nr:acetate--CoA ligase family protein [Deltaproteobacteria bacterium]
MRMFEYEGKELLRRLGVAVMPEKTAATVGEAAMCAAALGYPVVVKAQVRAGGRGKAGGVKVARDEAALRAAGAAILGMSIKGERCSLLLIAKAVDIAREFYAGVTLDAAVGRPVLIFSAEGGMDIERVAESAPEKVRKYHLSTLSLPRRHEIQEEVRLAGVEGDTQSKVTSLLLRLISAFFTYDCTTMEINPLAVTTAGECIALDAKVVIDDAALKRQGMTQTDSVPASDLEKRAAAIGVNYVQLRGRVAVIAGGAGLAMASMDLVNQSGCKAASFLDTGGGISSAHTAEALRISLATPGVEGVLINIFGGINNCGEVARGIAAVVDEDRPQAMLVVKMRGYSQDEGWAMLEARRIPIVKYGTTEEAVRILAAGLGVS